MPKIVSLKEIKRVLDNLDPVQAVEEGFAAYSRGEAVIPPVGELVFDNPPGDVHIKYGYLKGDRYYVVKIASGFYKNPAQGLPSSNGLMLLFDQKTGELLSVLLDGGHLTNVRTAAAGAVAAKYLAPERVTGIGILGAGVQGRMQLMALKSLVPCRSVWVWGPDQEELDTYDRDLRAEGYTVHTTRDPRETAAHCNLVVTATPSRRPLLNREDIRSGTHITAMGSDTPEKIELDPHILESADLVVADSREQCRHRGEISQALRAGLLDMEEVRELGELISTPGLGRSSEDQITVADLTGVAVQDLQIAKAVYESLP
jgi:ornithine cyclodeaminase